MQWNHIVKGDRSCQTLLFLHGFMGSHADWLEVTEMLGDEFCYVLPDLPGHGGTSLTDDDYVSMETVTTDLLDLVTGLKLNRVVLIGYSMGGRVALYTALKHPEPFQALVIESATAGIDDGAERGERAELDMGRANRLRQEGLERFVEEWYDASLFQSLKRFPERLAALKQSRFVHNADDLAQALRGLSVGYQPSLWSNLHQLHLPALIISGGLDDKHTGIAREMAQLIPNAKHEVIADAGHNVHLEKPEAFVAALRRFLARLPVSGSRYAGKDTT